MPGTPAMWDYGKRQVSQQHRIMGDAEQESSMGSWETLRKPAANHGACQGNQQCGIMGNDKLG